MAAPTEGCDVSDESPTLAQMDFIVGLDLGKKTDPAAWVVLGRTPYASSSRNMDEYVFTILNIHTFDLETEYHSIEDDVETLLENPAFGGRVNVAADFTGLGQVFLESLRRRESIADRIWGICFTSGVRSHRDAKALMNFTVPKKDLVGVTLLAIQEGRLHVHPDLPGWADLKDQLLSFTYKRAQKTTQFEGEAGTHDDIVTALCGAIWISDHLPYQAGAPAAEADASRITPVTASAFPSGTPAWMERRPPGPGGSQRPSSTGTPRASPGRRHGTAF